MALGLPPWINGSMTPTLRPGQMLTTLQGGKQVKRSTALRCRSDRVNMTLDHIAMLLTDLAS
jgi:hypothetical protein